MAEKENELGRFLSNLKHTRSLKKPGVAAAVEVDFKQVAEVSAPLNKNVLELEPENSDLIKRINSEDSRTQRNTPVVWIRSRL
mmetsp:Transcript_3140/g.3985  ORF Transcript_3140/g.3985 Transcript_3140/m.3985 type:complete len:83 (+) Transcript_3140:516-764(+)